MATDCGQGIRLSAVALFAAAQPWLPINSHMVVNMQNRKVFRLETFFMFIVLTPLVIVEDLAVVVKRS
jgi:hypothetical protein